MVQYLRVLFALPLLAGAWLVGTFGGGSEIAKTEVASVSPVQREEVMPAPRVAPTTTTTTAAPLPTYLDPVATELARAQYGQCGEFYDLALSVGWPADEWSVLSQIMWRESKCQPWAWSGSDAGLLQINKIHTEWAGMMGWAYPDDLFMPENNLLFAYRLWSESGWAPWRFSGEIPSN